MDLHLFAKMHSGALNIGEFCLIVIFLPPSSPSPLNLLENHRRGLDADYNRTCMSLIHIQLTHVHVHFKNMPMFINTFFDGMGMYIYAFRTL